MTDFLSMFSILWVGGLKNSIYTYLIAVAWYRLLSILAVSNESLGLRDGRHV